ncbi:hypothetical protein V5799_013394 [Amblyomma americanum]|uniref:Uncharacterized protein n=1 Tax=Amblyomma americanum TaxID=6943 RepID=A0AAQ4E617_AMBAM
MRSHCRLKGSLLQGSEPRDQLFQMLKVTRLPSLQSLLMKAPRRSHRQMSSRHPSHGAASCRKLKESLLVPSRPLLRARRTPRKRESSLARLHSWPLECISWTHTNPGMHSPETAEARRDSARALADT